MVFSCYLPVFQDAITLSCIIKTPCVEACGPYSGTRFVENSLVRSNTDGHVEVEYEMVGVELFWGEREVQSTAVHIIARGTQLRRKIISEGLAYEWLVLWDPICHLGF